ncbi:trypsin-like peptidase domain-containing protein [Candidatus Nomurabacteria bacterium]|nr:trypsin-like peptidase domain-containing protein [Candidatus Nomurabacteria bacterium]
MKDIFKNKDFHTIFFTSFLSLLVVIVVGLGLVWRFRGNIFGCFAKEYLAETQNASVVEKDVAGNTTLKQPIFSQDSLVVNAVKKTNPAVVSITISQEVPKYENCINPNQQQQQNPFGDLFPGFNFNIPQYQLCQNGTQKKEVGGGSGFFVSSDGLIVTNKHVVDQKSAEYTVFTNDGKKHTATIVARDPVLDIALIKISGSGFSYLSLGNSDDLDVGQSVIAIGNALGEFRNTVSVGVVSGLARSVTAGDSSSGNTEVLDHVIQTDAAINPGNSGGPLLNLNGEVVGVNVAIAEGSQNIGFALPINSVKNSIESVKSTGKIVRPYLGVRYVAINADLKDKNNLTVDYGVLVKAGATASDLAIIPGSPADRAGIVENDIILEIDGVKLDDNTSLASLIRQKTIGQVINLKIIHKGVEKTVSVTLTAAPDN